MLASALAPDSPSQVSLVAVHRDYLLLNRTVNGLALTGFNRLFTGSRLLLVGTKGASVLQRP